MHNVEPKVHLIAKSCSMVDAEKWLEELGVSQDAIHAITRTDKTSAEQIVEMAGRRCYKSFEPKLNPNVTQIRKDIGDYIDNILKVGHGSVIEHVYFTFAIENVSRVFTGEMNRHRAGMAISEGSMRFIRYTDIPYWVPTSIRPVANPHDENVEYKQEEFRKIELKKAKSQEIFKEVFSYCESKYAELCDVWKDELSPESKFKAKKEITSMMRRIIPMGVATGGVWTGNLRALRHIFNMRCDEPAEEEILLVATMMLERMKEAEPNFFGDFETNEKGYYRPKYPKV